MQCLDLTRSAVPSLVRHEKPGEVDWDLCYGPEILSKRRLMVTLWGMSLDGPVTQAPVLQDWAQAAVVPRDAEEKAWEIVWRWPGMEWKLHIDPLAAEPIREF